MASHLDPQLEDKILHEVKSQGVFDEFRKDSMADVDTKPAYQNLRQRVESTVKKFLSEQQWTPDMNKNQLREKLRRHITESGFLDVGVERIVDQVVNPKIGTVFQPRIEEITYKYLGLPPPPVKHEPPPPIMHPLPPLPLTGPPLKIETSSLLPIGLEQVSPDSDKATVKSDCHGDDPSLMDMDVDVDDKMADEDDESPPFEPLVKCVEPNRTIKSDVILSSENMINVETGNQQDSETQDTSVSANSPDPEIAKNANISFGTEPVIAQDSQLSEVSSDSNISDVTANASHSFMDNSSTHNTPQTISDQTEAVIELASANISEEAQMPKFSENSSEMIGAKSAASELHFDIKKDEIKFEGTERKANLLEQEGECNSVTGDDISTRKVSSVGENLESKEPPHHFGNLTIDTNMEHMQATGITTPAATPTPTPHDSSFGSSLEDTSIQQYKEDGEVESKAESMNVTDGVFPIPLQEQRDKKETSTSRNHGSSSSSSRHKKHSRDKRRPHSSKDKYKDRDRSKNSSHDKDRGSDRDKISDKSRYREKDKHRDKDMDHKEKNRSKNTKSKNDSTERTSSSKRSSSSTGRSHDTSSSNKNEKNITSKHLSAFTSSSCSSSRSESHGARREKHENQKKNYRSTSNNRVSTIKDDGSAESTKTEVPIDDHSSEKANKVRRHKSTDSNDENGGANGASRKNGGNEHEKAGQNTTSTNNDKKQSQIKDTKNSSHSPKGKSKNDHDENHAVASNMITEDVNTNALATQPHGNKVVILSDMLENPNINFIDLGPSSATYNHISDMIVKDCPIETRSTKSTVTPAVPNTQATSAFTTDDLRQLLFFEEANDQFLGRLRLIDNAMDRCRRVVNNLRFDCANELCDTYEELQNEDETGDIERLQTCATLTIDCVPTYAGEREHFNSGERSGGSPVGSTFDGVYDLHEKRKRNNNGSLIQSKPSPTPSDASVNSKENMVLDKNAGKQLIGFGTTHILLFNFCLICIIV